VVAPRLPHCVEKLSNQLAAFAAADPRSEVFACADSDGVPVNRGWLAALVGPLDRAAVTTGFRWYFPERGDRLGAVQSAWDSTWCVYHAFEGTVWGGAMAFTRKTFEQFQLAESLSRGVTDDLVVLARTRAAGGTVQFAAGAMVGSRPHQGFGNFLSWAVRQAALVKMVTPGIWVRGLAVALLMGAYYLLTVLFLVQPGERFGLYLPLGSLASLALINFWRAWLRGRVVRLLFPGWDDRTRPLGWRYVWAIPLADLLGPYVAVASWAMRVIRWRGVGYRVHKDRVERLSHTS
jgi:hypothetical protein